MQRIVCMVLVLLAGDLSADRASAQEPQPAKPGEGGGGDVAVLGELLETGGIGQVVQHVRNGGRLRFPVRTRDWLPIYDQLTSELLREHRRIVAERDWKSSYPSDLVLIYHQLSRREGFDTLVTADIVKRFVLTWAQAWLRHGLEHDPDQVDVDYIAGILDELALDAWYLVPLYGPHVTSDQAMEAHRRKDVTYSFEVIWTSHGLSSRGDVVDRYNFGQWKSSRELIVEEDKVLAAYRILETEMLRRVHAMASIEFVRRGGRKEHLAGSGNVAQFDRIMPEDVQRRYEFPAGGTRGGRRAMDVGVFLSVDNDVYSKTFRVDDERLLPSPLLMPLWDLQALMQAMQVGIDAFEEERRE